MRAICVLAVTVMMGATVARADWRDGCPAGYDRAGYERDPRLGAAPEPDSALTGGRALVGLDPTYHTAHASSPRSTTYDAFFHVQGRWSWLTGGLTGSYVYDLEGPTRTWWLNHHVASIGLRYDFEGELAADQAAKTQGASLRRGFAIQAIGGLGSSDLDNVDGFRREVALRPFDGYLLAPRALGVMAEFRIEQVGCYAVFAHLRGGMVGTGFGDARSAIEVPAVMVPTTLAVGAYVSDQVAVIAEYGVAVQRPPGSDNYASYQRVRAVIDITGNWGSVGGHLDFTTHVYGVVGGLYVAINVPWLERR
jgi:hypothetical protein